MTRFFDILFSGIAIIILLPFMIPIMIGLKLTGEHDIFYGQTRIGKGGKEFKVLKFATMLRNSPNMAGGLYTTTNDPRILPMGKFLRKTKINELPQLINVFVGDMSFVGPRPEVPYYVEMYTEEQKGVLSVRPGITDLASIKYRDENEILGSVADPEAYYVSTLMPDKLNINLEYVKKHSYIGDIKIIFMTIFEIFS